ncbi:MAG: TIGR04283 family arsenosugar biosynthesis glycosyltransferase [Candidatus Omnitrophica bacterium]|nr:TIGR04283 family arsenosugar biosynthesis glycosyltransferase [Candidatus Omnitrophota bacterium]
MISIIIPAVNEEETLPGTVRSIQANAGPHEVILVDGGSSDGTVRIAREAGWRVVESTRCHRAFQMNLGARQARGEILFFLHADTRIPPDAVNRIGRAFARPGLAGGGFDRLFDSASLFLKFSCLVAGIRCRVSGLFLGDQGIFIRRDLFEKLGGFRELDLFEDVDLCRRMKKMGRLVTLTPPVRSSARRFESGGPVRTTFSDLVLSLRYIRGADPNALAAERKPSGQKISVVIPALNEEKTLPGLLSDLRGSVHEIIVADGGSSDGTIEVARKFQARVIVCVRGRASQMNVGAALASGDILWFLHADTRLPAGWQRELDAVLKDRSVVGGGFRVVIDAPGFGYRFLDLWGILRTWVQRFFYGDQGIFVRRAQFEALGGFRDWPILEDLDFSARLSKKGKVAVVGGPLKTSARRWESDGWWRTVLGHIGLALRYQFTRCPPAGIYLIVMAKAPVPGQVKTRLLPVLSPEGAARLARRFLKETVALVEGIPGIQPVVAVSPPEAMEQIRELIGPSMRLIPQPAGDLGVRLQELFRQFFAAGAGGVIALGTDHPGLPKESLQKAAAELRRGRDRLVLGPTHDGGYYLIGLNRPHAELFQGIPWSTSEVLRTTVARAKSAGLRIIELPPWYDVDRPEDLQRIPKSTLVKVE